MEAKNLRLTKLQIRQLFLGIINTITLLKNKAKRLDIQFLQIKMSN